MTATEAARIYGKQIASHLETGTPVRIRWQPGNLTLYDMLFVPYNGYYLVGPKQSLVEDYTYVSVLNFGTVYSFRLGEWIAPGYVADKLTEGRDVDGAAIALLLSCIGSDPEQVDLEEMASDGHCRDAA